MDAQLAGVLFLFFLSLLYIGRLIYKSLTSRKGCASNCGKCAADFSGIKVPPVKN